MKKKILYIISLLLVLHASVLDAQNVILNAKIDTFAIRIGEQTKVMLDLSVDEGHEVVMPAIKDSLLVEGIEILECKAYDEPLDGGKRQRHVQEYLVTSFDSTRYVIPPFSVEVDKDTFTSNKLILDVYSVEIDTANINNIAGPTDVIDVELTWEEVRDTVYLSVLLIFIVLAFIWTIMSLIKNKPIIRRIKIKPLLPSHVVAINKFDSIKSDEKLKTSGNEKEYYTRLTDALREYMQRRFNFNAQEMTTSEIIDEMLKIKDKESIKELKEILEVSDLVKFAKMRPEERENERNMSNAIEFVNETKNLEEERVVAPKEIEITNTRSRQHKIILTVVVVILAVVIAGIVFLLTTDLYNMFS
ncbi:MAG: hypothetical protein IKA52_00135 [Bacteroidaceae bacterium]|nr:hypothetical protein [Bacteroidaceae bacterium]MBR4065184.1 hypothetical protein [Bacteroidaceae bacterium]